MIFEDLIADDLTGFFEHAREIKYNPSTSANSSAYAKPILAHISESGDLGIQGETPAYDKMMITVMAKDVVDPSFRDTFLIKDSSGSTITWFLFSWQGGGDYNRTWTLELGRSSRD